MEKKQTKAQIERKIQNAIVFVPKDKETQTIFFSDKGLRLTVNTDTAVIETGFHRHVFSSFTASGISRPFLYTKRLIEIAIENESKCKSEDGYSFERLKESLKEQNDNNYPMVTYIGWWLFNVFQPLYTIGESEIESFVVYENYIHNIATQSTILSEKTSDMTNKEFINATIGLIKELTEPIEEKVLFPKMTDGDLMKENIDALQEQSVDEFIKEGVKDEGEN